MVFFTFVFKLELTNKPTIIHIQLYRRNYNIFFFKKKIGNMFTSYRKHIKDPCPKTIALLTNHSIQRTNLYCI